MPSLLKGTSGYDDLVAAVRALSQHPDVLSNHKVRFECQKKSRPERGVAVPIAGAGEGLLDNVKGE